MRFMTKGLRNENQELVDHSLNSALLCKHITQHKSSQIYQSGKKNCKFTQTYLFKLYLWSMMERQYIITLVHVPLLTHAASAHKILRP